MHIRKRRSPRTYWFQANWFLPYRGTGTNTELDSWIPTHKDPWYDCGVAQLELTATLLKAFSTLEAGMSRIVHNRIIEGRSWNYAICD